jgi:glycine/D-amino acid oxidase-like deaminating enzyme
MNGNKTLDFIIVGQGLAGSLLAWRLLEAGKSVLIIDDASPVSTSRTAAGLINPLAGQRLFLIHHALERLQDAATLYKSIENQAGKTFYHEVEQLRLFLSDKQVRDWRQRSQLAEYTPFIGQRFTSGHSGYDLADPYGGFRQQHTGWLDTVGLLDYLQHRFKRAGILQQAAFHYPDLIARDNSVTWLSYRARHLVFCEGHRAINNPWFSWLPFQLTRGEILTLNSNTDIPNEIINAGKWLLPVTASVFRFGATYDRNNISERISDSGREQLLADLKTIFPALGDAELIEQKAGIRPNTRDKIPFIGRHPSLPSLSIFNGFGSRGSMMIPWYSRVFSQHLLQDLGLPADADILRYHD